MENYDAVVIGTGIGGSAASAILAHAGLKILILEKNPRIGGSCSWYDKEGFRIDMGTHLFSRGNRGPLGEVTRRIGLGNPIRFVLKSRLAHIKGFGVDACMPATPLGLPFWAARLAYQTGMPPREAPAMARLFHDVARMSPEEIDAWNGRTVKEFIAGYTAHPQAVLWLSFLMVLYFVVPTDAASAGESIYCLQKMLRQFYLSYPVGGAGEIPRTYVGAAGKFGARLLTGVGARSVFVEKGAVKGVTLADGTKVRARAVVSTTSLKDTVGGLASRRHFPEEYLDMTEKLRGSFAGAQVKYALKKPLTKAGVIVGGAPLERPGPDWPGFDRILEEVGEGKVPGHFPVYAVVPTNFDADLAPRGSQIITACTIAPAEEKPDETASTALLEGLKKTMRTLLPGIDRQTIFRDDHSGAAIAGWIGKRGGAAITTGQTDRQVGAGRPPHHTPLRGLYLAGDCAGGRGIGTELAAESGMACADVVIRDLRSGVV